LYGALFGWRCELCVIPFQFALPQFGLSKAFSKDLRRPSFKAGPFHFWTMEKTGFELGVDVDFDGHFHTHVFERIYPDSFVWPEYKPNHK